MNDSDSLQLFGTILVVLSILFGDDRLIGYSFLGVGVLLSIVSLIMRIKKKDKIEKEMRKKEIEQNVETRMREKGDKRRRRKSIKENENYKRKKF